MQPKFHEILANHFSEIARLVIKISVLRKLTFEIKLSFDHLKRTQTVLDITSHQKLILHEVFFICY